MSLFNTDLFRSFAIGFLIGTAAVVSSIGLGSEMLTRFG